MKIRTKFVLVIMGILLLGALFMMGWFYHSSVGSVSHQAIEGNVAFSRVIVEAVDALMNTGEQQHLDDYLSRAREFDSVAEIRVIRSPVLEKELGVKDSSRARDDLDRQVLASDQEIIQKTAAGRARAMRIISPIHADESCLACHAGFKNGEVISALSVTLLYQKVFDETMWNLAKNGIFLFLTISLVLAAIAVFFNKHILFPLLRIGAAVQRFGKGDFSEMEIRDSKRKAAYSGSGAPQGSCDEIDELATNLNDMAHNLKRLTLLSAD